MSSAESTRDITFLNDCVFCSIAQGQAEADVIAEADSWIAFFPLEPATPGHTLVIPRTHVRDLWHVDPTISETLLHATIHLGNAILRALNPDGMNLITSSGSAAEQTVFHLHLHLVPRWADDGFGSIWPPEGTPLNSRAKEGLADRIRDALSDLARSGRVEGEP